jgi:hypothetical protein
MEELLQEIRNFKNRAKTRRDRGRYESAAETLNKDAIPMILESIPSSPADWKTKLASELSDCFGILGGIYRRWALESSDAPERRLHLEESVRAYLQGYELEENPEYNLVNSYNKLNRLVSYILLEPDSLSGDLAKKEAPFDVKQELIKTESDIREQLKEKRRGDIWALADLALIRILLGRENAATAYAEFNAKAPPAFAYESALSTLRPLAAVDTPARKDIKEAVNLLEAQLGQLQ